MKFQVLRFF